MKAETQKTGCGACANVELSFVHADVEDGEHNEHWPFVYLHGNAEGFAGEAYDNAPDVCLSNQPVPDLPPGGKLILACNVHGEAAICCLWRREDFMGNAGFVSGRVALIADQEGLAHALDCDSWR